MEQFPYENTNTDGTNIGDTPNTEDTLNTQNTPEDANTQTSDLAQTSEPMESSNIPVTEAKNLFDEQSFANGVNCPPPQGAYPYGIPSPAFTNNRPPQYSGQNMYANPYYQNYMPQNAASSTDNSYRAMYGGNPYGQAPVNQGGTAPYNPYNYNGQLPQRNNIPPAAQMPQAAQIPPVPPSMPAADGTAAMKKPSKAWIIAVIVIIIALLAAVMILLAVRSKNSDSSAVPLQSGSSSGSESSSVTVNIPIQEKPALAENFYADKASGLLTTEGVAEYTMPSIVNLYMYESTTIAPSSQASGVIISEDGYIITNAHAVENMKKVKAKLYDGSEYEAKIIGYDTRTDLAVVKIEAADLVAADLGSANDMKQGEQVVAIGNASGYNDSVSVGYVSYVNREINSYTGFPITCIQTDAVLNFGNSGGALINMYGQVVGIVTSKYETNSSEKIGFAITTDFAKTIVEGIISDGYVVGRPRIGITYQLITAEAASYYGVKPGLLIATIDESCDIANTELQPDDIITEIDGIPMLTSDAVVKIQTTKKAGETVTAKVYRKSITGEESEFEITFTLMQDSNLG
ncbi:MAG: S1C family serine protease [Huintestinicola sp.]